MSCLDFDGKKFTNDTGHVHKRGDRPVNVSQWNQLRANGTLGGSNSDSEGDSDVAGRTQANNSSLAGVLAGGRPHLNQNLGNDQFQGNLNDFLKQMRNLNPPPSQTKAASANKAQGFIFAVQEPNVTF